MENFIEKAIILNGNVQLIGAKKTIPSVKTFEDLSSNEIQTLQEIEKEAIIKTIKHFDGNMSLSARALKIGRNTLYQKCSKYGISHH